MKLAIALVTFLLLFSSYGFASTLFLEFDEGELLYAGVQELNDVNYDGFYDADYVSGTTLVSFYLDDVFLDQRPINSIIDLSYSGEQKLTYTYLGQTQTVLLCNQNSVCEPCTQANCAVAETSLSCGDCAPSSQDSYCELLQDGICDLDCREEDVDCLLAEVPQQSQEELRDELAEELLSTPTPLFSSEGELDSTQRVFLLIGSACLCIALYFLFSRLIHKREHSKYTDMIPYGQKALAQGYSYDQIKQSLEHRGYSAQYIKGYLKALEHKP